MKLVNTRLFPDGDAGARKPVEIANGTEPVQDGRIYIELIKRPSRRQAARPTNTAPDRARDHERPVVSP